MLEIPQNPADWGQLLYVSSADGVAGRALSGEASSSFSLTFPHATHVYTPALRAQTNISMAAGGLAPNS